MNCFYQNTRGLRTKIAKRLKDRLTLRNYHIVGFTETWLSSRFDSEGIFDDTYAIHRADRSERTYVGPRNNLNDDNITRGGALIAIKNNISSIRMKKWEEEVPFDNVWIKINTKSTKKIFINCIYINHASNFNKINTYFKQLHDIINSREPDSFFVILGDFNLSCIEWYFENNKCLALNYEGRLAGALLDTLNLTNLRQVNFIKNHYNRILDLALTNINDLITNRVNGIAESQIPFINAFRA